METEHQCDAETVGQCPHISGRLVNVSVEDEAERFEWIKHADKFFAGHRSNSHHPGNISEMVRHYVRIGMKEMERSGIVTNVSTEDKDISGSDDGSIDFEKSRMRQEIEELRSRNAELKSQVNELRLERDQFRVRPETDKRSTQVGILIGEVLYTRDEATLDELVEILKRQGIGEYIDKFQNREDVPEKYRETYFARVESVEDLAERILRELLEQGYVEVSERNGRYYYSSVRDI